MMRNNILERVIIKFITILVILSIVTCIIMSLVTKEVESNIKNTNETKINYIYNRFGVDLELLCLMSTCQTIYVRDVKNKNYSGYDINTNGIVIREKKSIATYDDMLNEYNTGKHAWYVVGGNSEVVIKYPLSIVPAINESKLYIVVSIIIVLSLLMAITIVIVDVRFNKYKQSKSKNALNDQLRSELTESLHHELAGPISVIESNVKFFIKETIRCPHNTKHICRYYLNHTEIEGCKDCKYRGVDVGERLSSTLVSIESMKSILCTMSHLKKMRYQRENLNLSVILDSVSALNRINTYNVTTINIMDKELTSTYMIDGTLGDGVLFNSIMTLINNSNEANATQINITPKLLNNNIMELYISDNGTGITNSRGEIDKNSEDKIFSYGYSTKEDFSTIKSKASLFTRFMSILLSTTSNLTTSRGAGLAIARKLLRDNGGDIELVTTSENGTIFKIKFPVKTK